MSQFPFDYDEMLTRCVGKVELLERAMTRFRGDLVSDLEQLSTACDAKDADQIARTAHRIKGASANVSAHQLSTAAAVLEASARKHELNDLTQQWEQVETTAEILNEFLATHSLV